jgi:3-oxoacyl-[acyl-carrier protein] reductase
MNIIITGAGKGIGYQVVKILSKIDNANLYLISRSKDRLDALKKECLLLNPDVKITVIPFDLERLLFEKISQTIDCDHVDILINNAGIVIKKDFDKFEVGEIQQIININFIAPALLIKQLISRMGNEKLTHIVNIGSMGGFQGSAKFSGLSFYSAAKAALASLTECIATEYKEKNIKCNCLALGAVQTEMLSQAFPGFRAPLLPEKMAEFIADFALNGYRYFNGKVLPVSLSTP